MTKKSVVTLTVVTLTVIIVLIVIVASIQKTKNPSSLKDNSLLCVDYKIIFSKEGVGPREAELYLGVQHSAYPGIRLIWPVNVGKNAVQDGFRSLLFTPEPGDTLKFCLLDDDDLNKEEEKALIDAASAAGSIIVECADVYLLMETGKPLSRQTRLAVDSLLQLGAREIIRTSHEHPWDDYGSVDYIVPTDLPQSPNDVNPVTIASNLGLLRRCDIKVYQTRTQ